MISRDVLTTVPVPIACPMVRRHKLGSHASNGIICHFNYIGPKARSGSKNTLRAHRSRGLAQRRRNRCFVAKHVSLALFHATIGHGCRGSIVGPTNTASNVTSAASATTAEVNGSRSDLLLCCYCCYRCYRCRFYWRYPHRSGARRHERWRLSYC